jgi:hypothetical protein
MKRIITILGLLMALFYLFSCSKDDDNDEYRPCEDPQWVFDIDNGYRVFLGVSDYKSGMLFPNVYLYVFDDQQEYCPFPGLKRETSIVNGIIISGKLFYYYDISETWGGKRVSLMFNSDDISIENNTIIVDLGVNHNIWFKINGPEVQAIDAPVSKDNP